MAKDLEFNDKARLELLKGVEQLSAAVKSTLGPRGLDKMLVDESGKATVTNDGVTVLETARVEHPTANLLIASSYFLTYVILFSCG